MMRLSLPIVLATSVHLAAAQDVDCTPEWQSPFGVFFEGAINGIARDAIVFDDGSGPVAYFGGEFPFSGLPNGNSAGVLRYDGSGSWSAVGAVETGKPTNQLVVFDDGSGPALYRAGQFPTGLDRWNGGPNLFDWTEVGNASQGHDVLAMLVFDDGSGPAIHVGGDFTSMGGVAASGIARWDGASWSTLGSELTGSIVTMAVHDDGSGAKLYVGGNVTIDGSTHEVAVWDGASWSPIPGVLNGPVRALTGQPAGPSGPARLVVGGEFTTAQGQTVNHVAGYDGSGWSALGSGFPEPVVALGTFEAASGPELVAAWSDEDPGGPTGRTERFDGVSWQPLDEHDGHVARAFAPGDLGAGSVTLLGGELNAGYAAWDGSGLTYEPAVTTGVVVRARIHDLGQGPEVFALGTFSSIGGVKTDRAARFDGTAWRPMPGLSCPGSLLFPRDLELFDDGNGPALYAATSCGVDRWDGSTWSLVSDPGPVRDLAVFDVGNGPELFAGGDFDWSTGPSTIAGIASFDGTTWRPVGAGFQNGDVQELGVVDLGAGPQLAAAVHLFPASLHTIWAWNGAIWTQLGRGANADLAPLQDFAMFQNQLYALRSTFSSPVLRWSGSQWDPVPGIASSNLLVLEVADDGTSGPALFVGGQSALFRYDGTTWTDTGHPSADFVWDVSDGGELTGPTAKVLVGGTVFIDTWGSPCDAPDVYCTPKASSAGCTTQISTSDPTMQPISGAGDYSIVATGIQGQKNGHVFVGVSGAASLPFLGGTLCVQPPTKRGPLGNSGGSSPSSCDGTYAALVNDGAVVPLGLDAGAGQSAWYQLWYRDPQGGAGALGSAFSNAVQLDFE